MIPFLAFVKAHRIHSSKKKIFPNNLNTKIIKYCSMYSVHLLMESKGQKKRGGDSKLPQTLASSLVRGMPVVEPL